MSIEKKDSSSIKEALTSVGITPGLMSQSIVSELKMMDPFMKESVRSKIENRIEWIISWVDLLDKVRNTETKNVENETTT